MSRKLVTIDRFVPMDEDMEQLRPGEPSGDELATIFRDLEFRGLWEQFASRKESPRDYRTCLYREDLAALAERLREAGIFSIDTETTSTDPLHAELAGISFSF